jgi:1,2-diacylglycerol 3-alpha-glucosyltransferase
MKKTLHIAIVFANYGPYHLARVNRFDWVCHDLDWKVTGIELARSEIEYAWKAQVEDSKFPLISVMTDRPLEQTNFVLLCQKLYKILSQLDSDVVAISGYSRPTMLFILLWCLWFRKSIILFSETHEDDAVRVEWREVLKSLLIKRYHSILVGGQAQKRYLLKLGIPEKNIFLGYDVVGNEVFHPDKIRSLPSPLETSYFLSINRFISKKNIPFLISSYAEYRRLAGLKAWDLVLCGDGELRSQIERQIADLELTNVVHLPGFLQQDELLPYFANAHCFIHASVQEQWGLVVNEAMAAGLPVLLSNRCGCFEDLLVEGINGFGFDPTDDRQLIDLMLTVSAENIDLEKMGCSALQHIQKFSPDYFASGLMQAVQHAIASR